MLPAFLTDNRIEYHHRRIIRAHERRIEILEGQADLWKQLFEGQRQRAARAEAELARLRTDLAARVLRLETAAGFATPNGSDDATEN